MDPARFRMPSRTVEQRLGFRLEPATEKLLRQNVKMIETISGDRLRREIELIFNEVRPERILQRAGELGILKQLHPALRGDGWLAENFALLRREGLPAHTLITLYLCLLVYHFTEKDMDSFLTRFKWPQETAHAMRDTTKIRDRIDLLGGLPTGKSGIYRMLDGYSLPAIRINKLAADSPVVKRRLRLFLNRLHCIKPLLSGEELMRLGVPAGPELGWLLQKLLDAKLDGNLKTKEEEEKLVKRWMKKI